jgi:hypothetical protein
MEALERKIADLETNMERRVEEKTVAKVNEIMPDLAQRIAAHIAGGQTGPLPLLSLGASHLDKEAPRAQSEDTLHFHCLEHSSFHSYHSTSVLFC